LNIVKYNQGAGVSKVGFMFACPGQKEEIANRVVSGVTGKNLNTLLSILSNSNFEKIREMFPSGDRYDYLITNASEIIHYPALDGTSLPKRSEYSSPSNITRIINETSDLDYVFAFGEQAKSVSKLISQKTDAEDIVHPSFITSLPHLSLLSINQIKFDTNGQKIEKGDPAATYKRLQVVAKMIEGQITTAR
jgi:hypothetical protein